MAASETVDIRFRREAFLSELPLCLFELRKEGVQEFKESQEFRRANAYPRPHKLNLGYVLFNTSQLHWLTADYPHPWLRLLNSCNSLNS